MDPLNPKSIGSERSQRSKPAPVDAHKRLIAQNQSVTGTSPTKAGADQRQNVFAETSKSLAQQAPAALRQSQNIPTELAQSETAEPPQGQGLKRLGSLPEDLRGRPTRRLEQGSSLSPTRQLPDNWEFDPPEAPSLFGLGTLQPIAGDSILQPPSLNLLTPQTDAQSPVGAPAAVSRSPGSPFEEIVRVTREQIEQRFNFGEASGIGLNCLLHSLKQLQTLNQNYHADAQEVADLRDGLQMLDLIREGEMIDLMRGLSMLNPTTMLGTVGDTLANALGVRIQALVSSANSADAITQATAGPVFGYGTNPQLLSVLTYGAPGGEHFIPLWPKPLAAQTSQPQASPLEASQATRPDSVDQRTALFAQASQARPTDLLFMQNPTIGGPLDAMPLPELHEGKALEGLDGDWASQDVVAERFNQLQQMDDAAEVTFDVKVRGKINSAILSKSDIMTILHTADQHQATDNRPASQQKKQAAVKALNKSKSQTWERLRKKGWDFKINLATAVLDRYAPHITNPTGRAKPVTPGEKRPLPDYVSSMTESLKSKMNPNALAQLNTMGVGAQKSFEVKHKGHSYNVSLDQATIAFILHTADQHQATDTSNVSEQKKQAAVKALNNSNSQAWNRLPIKGNLFKRRLVTMVIDEYALRITNPKGKTKPVAPDKRRPLPDYASSMTESLKSKMDRDVLTQLNTMGEGAQMSFEVKHKGRSYTVNLDRATIAFLLNTADQHQTTDTHNVSDQKKQAAVKALNNSNSQAWNRLPIKNIRFKRNLASEVIACCAKSITDKRSKLNTAAQTSQP